MSSRKKSRRNNAVQKTERNSRSTITVPPASATVIVPRVEHSIVAPSITAHPTPFTCNKCFIRVLNSKAFNCEYSAHDWHKQFNIQELCKDCAIHNTKFYQVEWRCNGCNKHAILNDGWKTTVCAICIFYIVLLFLHILVLKPLPFVQDSINQQHLFLNDFSAPIIWCIVILMYICYIIFYIIRNGLYGIIYFLLYIMFTSYNLFNNLTTNDIDNMTRDILNNITSSN
jgi:hypothetical protein